MRRHAFGVFLLFLILNITILLQNPYVTRANETMPQSESWYTIDGGWINVTKTTYKWAARNSSYGDWELMYFYRYSNNTPLQDEYRGFIWSESLGYGTPSYTFRGQGTAYLVYNDDEVLVYKRVLRETDIEFEQYYTFWRDYEYFAWESKIKVKADYIQNQIQFGIFIGSMDGENVYAFMGYKKGEVIKGARPDGWGLGSLPITSSVIYGNKAFPWQAVKTSGHNCSVGWILTYFDPPWMYLSAGKGGDGELQYCAFYSNPATNAYFRLPYVPFEYKISTIVYPFYGDQYEWYQPIQSLASELYSNISKLQSCDALNYAFAQHDPSSSVHGGVIANRIGVIALGWTIFNGFFIKNTVTWNYYPDVEHQPIFIRAGEIEWPYPDLGIIKDSGTSYLHVENSPVDSSSQSISTDSTPVWLKFKNDKSDVGWDFYIETWGDSDKFNITIIFRNKVPQKIKSSWTYMRSQGQINSLEFIEITPGITADYIINDPYLGYCGYLIKKLEGNASGIMFSENGAKIYFINNNTPQEYAAGTAYYIKLMLWAHYGKVTSEAEITGYHTNPELPNTMQYFAWSPKTLSNKNSKLYLPFDVWNSSATFPQMRQLSESEYMLTAIASGTKTFTLFLNKTIFPTVNQIDGVDSWSYDPLTGNLTFLATFSGAKEIKISLEPPPLAPMVQITPENVKIQLGQFVLFNSTILEGLPPYDYQWYVNGSVVNGEKQSTFLFTPTISGVYEIWLQVYDSLGQGGVSNTAFASVSGGYNLNLQIYDWDTSEMIQGADVHLDLSMRKSDERGWANWTGIYGTVNVRVEYYGYLVNETSLNIDSDMTIAVRCRLYDVHVTVKTQTEDGTIYLANLTVISLNNEKIISRITGLDGYVYLPNIPNGFMEFKVYSALDVIADKICNITFDEQNITIIADQNYGVVSLLWSQEGLFEGLEQTFGNKNFEKWLYTTLPSNYKMGSRFQLAEKGYVVMISANIRTASGTGNVKACIYSDLNGAPNMLKGVSAVLTIDATRKWWNFSFHEVNLEPGYYWLCLISDANIYLYCDFGANNQMAYTWKDNFNTGPSENFGTCFYENLALNIFAVYKTEASTNDIKFYDWNDDKQENDISLIYSVYKQTWTLSLNASYGIQNNDSAHSKMVMIWVSNCNNSGKIANLTIVIKDPANNIRCIWSTTTWDNLGETNAVSWIAIANVIYTIEIWINGSANINMGDSVTINLKLKASE